MKTAHQFDRHADTYDTDLNRALSVSGESKEYFAQKRVEWLERCIYALGEQPCSAIDYGCGIGDTSALLGDVFGLESVVGLDTSSRSLELAASRHGNDSCRFVGFEDHVPGADVDLAYCNGVFHHIPPGERRYSVDYIRRCLRPGGLFAFWENNPWNPGTRYVMSITPFDRDAITLSPPAAGRLLRAGGFNIVSVSYLFFFPRALKPMRIFEPYLFRIPLGAQYQILCKKPD